MSGHTPHGYPYAIGSDPLIDWPATSLELANLLEARLRPTQVRARCKVAQGGGIAVTPLLFTEDAVAPPGVSFNVGGYTFRSAGGVLRDGIYVPEAGYYRCSFQAAVVANSQAFTMQMLINGAALLPDGSYAAASTGGPTSLSNQFLQLGWAGKLAAGDLVTVNHFQSAAPQPLLADVTTWHIEGRPL